jgi:hypothetical protein
MTAHRREKHRAVLEEELKVDAGPASGETRTVC